MLAVLEHLGVVGSVHLIGTHVFIGNLAILVHSHRPQGGIANREHKALIGIDRRINVGGGAIDGVIDGVLLEGRIAGDFDILHVQVYPPGFIVYASQQAGLGRAGRRQPYSKPQAHLVADQLRGNAHRPDIMGAFSQYNGFGIEDAIFGQLAHIIVQQVIYIVSLG